MTRLGFLLVNETAKIERADGVLEAIVWHGGEAQTSKQQVLKMNAAERAALIKFVESL